MIIDAHTHRYANEVISDPECFAKKHKELHWLELVSPNDKKCLQGWVSEDQMIEDMEEDGVDKTVLLGWYWENPETCIMQNDWCANWLSQNPDKFIGFVSLHPNLKNPIEELKKRQDQGFMGMGECHPWLQGSSPMEDNWMECMQFASDRSWPVTYHVTEPVGHNYRGRTPTPFEDLLWLVRAFPELKIILAHAGGLFPFYELNPKIRPELENVYYDLAACPLLYDPVLYGKLIEVVGPGKILWGTDYPLRIFPKSQKKPDFATFRNFIEQETQLTDSERNAIFGLNLLSLLPC